MSNPKAPNPNKPPTEWTQERLDAVIRHYDSQTDEEEAAEIDAAEEVGGYRLVRVPRELVAEVEEIVRLHESKAAS